MPVTQAEQQHQFCLIIPLYYEIIIILRQLSIITHNTPHPLSPALPQARGHTAFPITTVVLN